ncbi:Acetyltransferase (GNAT) family protein [Lachnospiraceae bacterium XBB1006]|nr:Acetyltransferase (GNAT) family protein [Lachnospiraceae bacterium XBB1006]
MGLFDGLGVFFLGAAVIDEIKTRNIKPYPLHALENYELYCADEKRLSKRELEKNIYAGKYMYTDEEKLLMQGKQGKWNEDTLESNLNDASSSLSYAEISESSKEYINRCKNDAKRNIEYFCLTDESLKEKYKDFDIDAYVEKRAKEIREEREREQAASRKRYREHYKRDVFIEYDKGLQLADYERAKKILERAATDERISAEDLEDFYKIAEQKMQLQKDETGKMHEISIRRMFPSDKEKVEEMMRTFYASPAISTNGSEPIFEENFKQCTEPPHTYADGFVFDIDSSVQGYGMIAKSYSTEYGRQCIWIEDIYVKEEYRGLGVGSLFLKYIKEQYPDALIRLEVEKENDVAIHVYESAGFDVLPYTEMKYLK